MLDAVIYVLLLSTSVCLLPQYHLAAIAAQISKSDNFYPLFVVVHYYAKGDTCDVTGKLASIYSL